MANDTLTFRVAFAIRWLLWAVKFVVIWPLATIALLVLLVFWKGDTTPGQLLAEHIEYVRAASPTGQYPVSDCPDVYESIDFHSSPWEPPSLDNRCAVIFTDAAGYIEDINLSLSRAGKALWVILSFLYTSLAVIAGNRPDGQPRPFKYGTRKPDNRVVYTENTVRTLIEDMNNRGDKANEN